MFFCDLLVNFAKKIYTVSMPHLIPKKNGFTLVEVLLVIAVVGIVSTAAISSYVDSTRTFTFFERYQTVISAIRSARSEAVTSKQVDVQGELVRPDYYGVNFANNGAAYTITVFADVGSEPLEFDDADVVEKEISLSTPYVMSFTNMNGSGLDWPINLFYETETGNLASYAKGDLLDYANNKYFTLKFEDKNKGISKYIVVFQVSGLAEEFVTAPSL